MAAARARSRSPRSAAGGYLDKTHRPLNCLMFILPLLTAYEAGALFFPGRLLATQHLAALLRLFGATASFLPPLGVLVVLLLWHIFSRQRWRVDAAAVAGMAAESVLCMVPLVLMNVLVGRLRAAAASAGGDGKALAAEILIGVGAGIYEEFLFRLAGIGLFLLLCVDIVHGPKRPMVTAAVILTSVLFALYHFLGPTTFEGTLFVFYALAGAYLAGLYIARGFGVAVGTHACYNIVVALL